MTGNGMALFPARSAFAAAFLSFLLPGLGHVYLGRWLRALLWAVLPVLGIVAGASLALGPNRSDHVAALADPDVLIGVIGFIVLDLLYRLAAVLDAYRLARDPAVGSTATRMLSTVGLVAISVVLVASHVVLAQPVLLISDTIDAIAENAGDDSEIVDLDRLAAQNEDFLLQLAPPSAGAPETIVPTLPRTEPVVRWDRKERLNILLIGADGGRKGVSSYLTDSMITISADPKTGRVAFISLPRDASGVPLPKGWAAHRAFGGTYDNKINTLYTVARGRPDLFPGDDAQRGYKALMGTLGELYGLDIDWYVAVDLDSFRTVVNTLGGVVLDVQLPVRDNGFFVFILV